MINKLITKMIIAMLILFHHGIASADLELTLPLHEGKFPCIEKAKLGRPTVFWNLLNEGTKCFPLIVEDQQVDFIYNARKTKNYVVFHKCERGELAKGDTLEMTDAPKGSVYGYPEPESYLLRKIDSKWSLSEIKLPGYNGFSYDSFCDDNVAYWAYMKEAYYAYVYDVRRKRILFEKKIGSEDIGTDDPWLFGQPKWDKSCQSVEFPQNYFLKSKLKTVIKDNK